MIVVALMLWTIASAKDNKRFGVEGGFLFCNTAIDVPGIYKDMGISAAGGNSFDIGIGAYVCATTDFGFNFGDQYSPFQFRFDFGGHYWCVPFNPSMYGEYTIDDERIFGNLEETGSIDFMAIYFDCLLELKYAFAGIGMDCSFANWYNSSLRAYDESNTLVAEVNNSKKSMLTDKFNNRADIILKAGLKIPVNSFSIRPTVSFSLPTSSLFETHVTSYDPYFETSSGVNFNAFTIKYGIWLSYGIFGKI